MSGSAASEAQPAPAEAEVAAGGKVVAARSSIWDSIKGCGLAAMRIDKEELRRRSLMPEYICIAMATAIRNKDWNAGVTEASSMANRNHDDQVAPEAPMVVFVNFRSGGRRGPTLKGRLQELMAEEQVFDLSAVKPHDFVQHGLTCLEKLADLSDSCAKATREKLRVIVAGGDGTVGWVLGSLATKENQFLQLESFHLERAMIFQEVLIGMVRFHLHGDQQLKELSTRHSQVLFAASIVGMLRL